MQQPNELILKVNNLKKHLELWVNRVAGNRRLLA